jgi:FkbM family methyltransferase
MRSFLVKLAIKAHALTPSFKGKQFIYRMIQRVTGPTTQKTIEGILLETRITSTMDLSYFREGGHSLIRDEIKRLQREETFLDIGANVGYFSLLASKAVGAGGVVLAVEPSLRELEVMIKNIRRNRATNVAVISLAAAQHSSLLKLNLEPEHTGLNKIVSEDKWNLTQQTLATSIQQLIPPHLLPIHLVKIDVEGYELFALIGIKSLLENRSILRLIIEISPEFLGEHGQRPDDIYEMLSGYGYKPNKHTEKEGKQWDEVFSLVE